MVAAVTIEVSSINSNALCLFLSLITRFFFSSQWPGKPPCGSFVRIHHGTKKSKSIVVRIVDTCAGCASGSAHLDLTKAAFEKLYDQDVGMVEGLKAKVIPCPSKVEQDWNDDVVSLYFAHTT
jgi:hypothetical protein